MTEEDTSLTLEEIKEIIPHRPPFLLLDKILDHIPGEEATGIKDVSKDDVFLKGHFPTFPIMPGVLVVEALAQAAGVMMAVGLPAPRDPYVYLLSIDRAKFKGPVRPGDQLILKVKKERMRFPLARCHGLAYVKDRLVTEASFSFMSSRKTL